MQCCLCTCSALLYIGPIGEHFASVKWPRSYWLDRCIESLAKQSCQLVRSPASAVRSPANAGASVPQNPEAALMKSRLIYMALRNDSSSTHHRPSYSCCGWFLPKLGPSLSLFYSMRTLPLPGWCKVSEAAKVAIVCRSTLLKFSAGHRRSSRCAGGWLSNGRQEDRGRHLAASVWGPSRRSITKSVPGRKAKRSSGTLSSRRCDDVLYFGTRRYVFFE